jgi:hypothetical protein
MATEDKFTVERLDVDNYATWSIRMRALLITKGLWGAVTGDSIDPDKDQKALAQIILHVKDHHLMTVGNCSTSKIAWETLKHTYEAKTNARKVLLRRELTAVRLGATEALTVYAARAKDIQAQLRAAGDDAKDQEVAIQFLAGLPPAYSMISTVLTAQDKELTIDEMLPKLLNVEQAAAQRLQSSEAALLAKPRKSFSKGQPPKDDRTCFYCGRRGHLASQCLKKKRDRARLGNSSGRNGQQHSAVALTASSEAAAPSGSGTYVRWVLDTGASRHLTPNKSILLNPRPLDEAITITFGNQDGNQGFYGIQAMKLQMNTAAKASRAWRSVIV